MLYVVPLTLKEANAAIAAWHRHHAPVVNHRFSIGCVDDAGVLHGICIAANPASQHSGSTRDVLEVTRLATDGTKNACSILYAAAARAARAMGYKRIQTFTLPEEGGASLRAAAWVNEGLAGGNEWTYRHGRKHTGLGKKMRWAVTFADRPPLTDLPTVETPQLHLFAEGEV